MIPNCKPLQPKPVAKLSKTLEDEAAQANKVIGTLPGYSCDKCLNRGIITVVEDERLKIKICSCVKVRKCISELQDLGINASYTLDNFKAQTAWQKNLLQAAKNFIVQPVGWFYVGGQVGCGKSHICSAIVRELLLSGHAAKYILWEDTAAKLKSFINDFDKYEDVIKPLREADILYIDDFLKPTEKSVKPTPADLRQAYAILNARYNNPNAITIISSEHWLSEILALNEAVGSRIVERAGENKINIARKSGRNYRLLETGKVI